MTLNQGYILGWHCGISLIGEAFELQNLSACINRMAAEVSHMEGVHVHSMHVAQVCSR